MVMNEKWKNRGETMLPKKMRVFRLYNLTLGVILVGLLNFPVFATNSEKYYIMNISNSYESYVIIAFLMPLGFGALLGLVKNLYTEDQLEKYLKIGEYVIAISAVIAIIFLKSFFINSGADTAITPTVFYYILAGFALVTHFGNIYILNREWY